MKAQQVVLIFRFFDYQKTIEFYIDWLGFEIILEYCFYHFRK
ncbi:glyoxalase superfamily protein [Chryseobacterium sp. FH2]|nr:glyoxalase superfamily protein [Chryseobacterium sp. FH2]